jgi:hypothetical protein
MSGGVARPHDDERENLEEAKSQEGIGSLQRLTADAGITDPHPEQSPEGGAMGRGAGGQPSVASQRQRREGSGHRRGDRAGCGEQTPGGRTLDVAVG